MCGSGGGRHGNRLTDGVRMLWLLICLFPPVSCSRMVQDVVYKDRHSRDYVSAGPNSCHFDRSHTSIWMIYCMNVTAVTAQRNYTSQEHCLDVAEIVQTEAPVNLTYELKDAGGDEMGHNALLSWTYPVPSHLQYGWITLVYELQYRRVTEADNWKVKHPLREPHVELLGLPVGDYVVRVRCRSHNYGLWSKWSSTLLMSIPDRLPAGKLLLRILMSGVGVVALVVIIFGVILQRKRTGSVPADPTDREKDALMVPCDVTPAAAQQFTLQNPKAYLQSLPPYCSLPAEASTPSLDVPSLWLRPEIMTLPGSEYSVMRHPNLPNAVPAPDPTAVATTRSPQDCYTCVQLMNETGEVHLVQCLPPAYCREFSSQQRVDSDEEEKEEEEEGKLPGQGERLRRRGAERGG
ncbi:Growth hormone receptor [Collichthys lucidus]|uniref:Growth hormone receptor n=1 Tax=Collichthys lucidus TaxID=240159 RepID=A0A4U5U141_COLLU|nr:Growth hormone receptor [Collichthys lucidus]